MKNEPKIKVPEFMTSNVLTINQMAPVREAMNEMKEHCSSSLIVARHDEDYEYVLPPLPISPIWWWRRTCHSIGWTYTKSCGSPS